MRYKRLKNDLKKPSKTTYLPKTTNAPFYISLVKDKGYLRKTASRYELDAI